MPTMQSPPGAYTVIDGRRYLYFVGTGYLGLQGHPEVIRAACRGAEQYGIGTATSRTGFGDSPPVLDVERKAAALFGADDAFYFMSGYVGNHILISALREQFDVAFVDECSHYCVTEALQLAGHPVYRFAHGDADELQESLQQNLQPGQRPLVASDGVFAARGNIAPVADFCRVLEPYDGSMICIDDAHAVAVLGENGRGTYEHAGLNRPSNATVTSEEGDGSPRLFFSGTLSKAVGGFGGILPGSTAFIEQLRKTSTYYGGASAPAAPVAAATARALDLLAAEPAMRRRLHRNVAQLKAGLRTMGLSVDDSPVPIICLELGDAENMRRIQRELMEQEILIAHMAAYSGLGPDGALRIAVFATHTEAMIDQLLDRLRQLV